MNLSSWGCENVVEMLDVSVDAILLYRIASECQPHLSWMIFDQRYEFGMSKWRIRGRQVEMLQTVL